MIHGHGNKLARGALIGVVLAAGCHFDIDGLEGPGGGAVDGAIDLPAVIDGEPPVDLLSSLPDGFQVPDGLLPGEVGYPCATAAQCANGLCIDGFCCDDLCDLTDPASLCKACNVPGFEGHCVDVLAGTDPRGQCPMEDPMMCGRNGLCDGNGQCALYPAGFPCAPPSCSNDAVTYTRACDGLGTCLPPMQPVSCYPYACANAQVCATTCTGPSMCAQGVVCMPNGGCGQHADGQPCLQDNDCQSGNCAQGACCGSTCDGICYSCNLPGTQGLCVAVPAGSDPLNQCSAQSRDGCGRDGTCDGAGACRLWTAGTTCSPPGCMGDNLVSARTCDGNGACLMPRTTSCGAYSCNPTIAACYTSCTNDNQCAMGKKCKIQNGKCM
jgi:hypothetical protein